MCYAHAYEWKDGIPSENNNICKLVNNGISAHFSFARKLKARKSVEHTREEFTRLQFYVSLASKRVVVLRSFKSNFRLLQSMSNWKIRFEIKSNFRELSFPSLHWPIYWPGNFLLVLEIFVQFALNTYYKAVH